MKGYKRGASKKKCRKVEYKSKNEAKSALKEYGRSRGCKGVYKCPHHEGKEVWHLTSKK